MITLTKIRDLDLAAATAAGRSASLSAASGLVRCGGSLYVIADDEHHLAVFGAGSTKPGRLVRLFDGELPAGRRDRKKRKPDLEALALLPPHAAGPHGALLALGSASRPNRRSGVVLGLDADGAVNGMPQIVDLSPLLAPLDDVFPAVNIEGAAVRGDELLLFQRGNKRQAENAVVRYPLASLLDLLTGAPADPIAPSRIDRIDLGHIGDVPLCFTDAALLPDGTLVFTAVAEDTEDSYVDGRCAGAAVGILDGDAHVTAMHRIEPPLKIEGVDARPDGGAIALLLLTDADDPEIPAGLFAATLPR